jgi:hypothetical protein
MGEYIMLSKVWYYLLKLVNVKLLTSDAQMFIVNGVIIVPPLDFEHPSLLHLELWGRTEYMYRVVTYDMTSMQNFNKILQAIPYIWSVYLWVWHVMGLDKAKLVRLG